jgi:hypothetical protein
MLEIRTQEMPLLRQARKNIFKFLEIHAEAIQQRDVTLANLRTRSADSTISTESAG